MGAKIVYKNYALIDKSMTSPQSDDISEFACLEDLKYSNTPAKLATFEEQYMYGDVGYPFYCPGEESCEILGYVSDSMCDRSGVFDSEEPPSVWIFMDETDAHVRTTSDGITLYFSPWEEEYATEVEILWLVRVSDGEPITIQETFYPDKNIYFCSKRVENYARVEVRFKKWSFGNRRARLYRIEFGRETIYEGDSVFSVSADESVNLVSDQISVNTSSVVLTPQPGDTFQKQQEFEIWYDNKLIAAHFVKDIKMQDSRVTITGNDVLSKLDSGKVSWSEAPFETLPGEQSEGQSEEQEKNTFRSCLYAILKGKQGEDVPSVLLDEENSDAALLSSSLKCKLPEDVSRREALTAVCLAMGAYVDTSGSAGIIIRSAREALHAASEEDSEEDNTQEDVREIPEVHVFSGDSTEIKESYRTLTIKYKDGSGTEGKSETVKNSMYPDSTQELELDLTMLNIESIDTGEGYPTLWAYLNGLKDLYANYYFRSEFYTAKAVMGEDIAIGDRVTVNEKDAFLTQRTLNLDGDKMIADGTYKLVKGR